MSTSTPAPHSSEPQPQSQPPQEQQQPQPSQPQPQQQEDPDPLPAHLNPSTYPRTTHNPTLNTHITLTYDPLDATAALQLVSSPQAGANVLFLGTTRDTFGARAVAQLSYTAYPPLALKTLSQIAEAAVHAHRLLGVAIAHRLGDVPIGESSIAIAVSAGHRGAAWRAGEEVLERCKERAEIWKREVFVDGGGEWRENRERDREGALVG
ncbi:molybdopterin synthase catalytic subunit [Aspergillus brunneoviolaceus CBS 621.78]|uniref:Molybdopterin synthase catalytic subunit n=1 Tax=Aspergillus brunneoviolaceus CBS 621.78 TaxID=1450534 RepID=A0ACD1FZE6_9EURO|nr:Molybdopterin synthase catalytic subunit [Aspergillus brunneoviolaceus CBS 621.78]RAH42359.1 Molybdopterin synthase catalytic subunit [Aspergillus brunneoviolaceus CBS 621.78]